MKKARRKQYYLAAFRAIIFAVSFVLLIMLKNAWMSAVMTQTLQYCEKHKTYKTYSTGEPLPKGDSKVLHLVEQSHTGNQ